MFLQPLQRPKYNQKTKIHQNLTKQNTDQSFKPRSIRRHVLGGYLREQGGESERTRERESERTRERESERAKASECEGARVRQRACAWPEPGEEEGEEGSFGSPFRMLQACGRNSGEGAKAPKDNPGWLANPLPEERLQDCRRVWPELRVSVEPSPRSSRTQP